MIWQERYQGLPFTREQVEEIGLLLGLELHEQARFAAQSIALIVAMYEITYLAKKRMGPVDKVSSKLRQIAAAASELSALLKDDAVCDVPFDGLWQLMGSEPELKRFDRQPLWRDKSIPLETVRSLVANIAYSSNKLAENDKLLRSYYFLPPLRAANNNLETSAIWPELFMAWEQHGRQVAGSVNGTNKLHRLVNLVHEATGLGKPSVNTLNRAIQRWKQDPRRGRADNAVWYFGGQPPNSDAIGED